MDIAVAPPTLMAASTKTACRPANTESSTTKGRKDERTKRHEFPEPSQANVGQVTGVVQAAMQALREKASRGSAALEEGVNLRWSERSSWIERQLSTDPAGTRIDRHQKTASAVPTQGQRQVGWV